ncbi:hypothetical protein GMRT_12232 [Giardia muris]|uniref:Uncharacterized protein n=1 Tax=Giardia muris TaxID=5742 RepID=A0A4Z1SY32_GIAMU|nr:hypothetical protein GMRT_12232 [Giardia muris]|eukprot:TNJ30614.1 hypothetical protein GMRT_12232 [Giardia muris]
MPRLQTSIVNPLQGSTLNGSHCLERERKGGDSRLVVTRPTKGSSTRLLSNHPPSPLEQILHSAVKRNTRDTPDLVERMIQPTLGANTLPPPDIPLNLTSAFCPGRIYRSQVYVPAGLATEEMTQHDLDRIQLKQGTRSCAFTIEPTHKLGEHVEDYTCRRILTDIQQMPNTTASPTNNTLSEKLQHAGVLRFMGKMAEKPRIQYPRKNLVETERDSRIRALGQSIPIEVSNGEGKDQPLSLKAIEETPITSDFSVFIPEDMETEQQRGPPILPEYFDEQTYSRLLDLERRVKEFHSEQIKLRAVTQTTYRRLYNAALKEYLGTNSYYTGEHTFRRDMFSIVDAERVGITGSKYNKTKVHALRTDDVMSNRLIRHLPRLFKSKDQMLEAAQIEGIISGYKYKLQREMEASSETPSNRPNTREAIVNPDVFLTELDHPVTHLEIEHSTPEPEQEIKQGPERSLVSLDLLSTNLAALEELEEQEETTSFGKGHLPRVANVMFLDTKRASGITSQELRDTVDGEIVSPIIGLQQLKTSTDSASLDSSAPSQSQGQGQDQQAFMSAGT